MSTVLTDPQRQEQARRYARLRRRLWLLELGLGLAYLLAWLLSGANRALADALAARLPFAWAVPVAFALVFFGLETLLGLPLAYYRGFVLPHRFGLSTQTRRGWWNDQVKGWLVGLVLGLPLLVGLYALLARTPERWWLYFGLVLTLLQVVLAQLAPVLLLPLFYKQEPLGEEHADLVARLTRLAKQAGTRVRGVFRIDMSRRTKAANAALTGLGRTRRILLGDTLLEHFTTDEIETVLAHELAHHLHRDIPLSLAVGTLILFGGLYLIARGLDWAVAALELRGLADPAGLPLLLLGLQAYNLVLMPLLNAFSRWREQLADDYAVRVTGKPEAFANALRRLADQNLAEVDPERWVVWLFYDHPPLGERIRRALAAARSMPGAPTPQGTGEA